MIKHKYDTVDYISKVSHCPYCNKELLFREYSDISVRNSIEKLFGSMNSHFSTCKSKKNNKEKKQVKVSINTKMYSEKLYSSSFATEDMLVG